MDLKRPPVPEEQLRYADWLDAGTKIGLALLVATFAVYASGLVPPQIPLSELPRFWALPVNRYLASAGLPSGWGWLKLAGRADMMNFIGIAFLSMVTIACYARLAVTLLRRGDTACALIVLAEIGVLAIAASGLAGGAH